MRREEQDAFEFTVPCTRAGKSYNVLQSHVSSDNYNFCVLEGSVVDPGCLSRISDPNFSIPDSGSKVKKIPDPHPRLKLSEYDLGCFFSIPDPGSGSRNQDPGSVKKHRITDPGFGSATLLEGF
jgi:hypothetical protein